MRIKTNVKLLLYIEILLYNNNMLFVCRVFVVVVRCRYANDKKILYLASNCVYDFKPSSFITPIISIVLSITSCVCINLYQFTVR